MTIDQSVAAGNSLMSTTFEVIVADRYVIADGVVALELERPDGTELPEWTPGAHIDVIVGDAIVRQYSLCGDHDDRSRWRIAVLREQEGRGGSAFIHDEVAKGSTILISEPRNHFELVAAPQYVFVAGGIGITPILAMIRSSRVQNAEWVLHYGGRTASSMAFATDLVETYGDRICLHPQDEVGLLDLQAIVGQHGDDAVVYCCGPGPLLKAIESHCTTWPKGALHVERFEPKEHANPNQDVGFEVELRRSGQIVQVGACESVLEAVRGAGIPITSSCEEGTCGTCEVPVLEGDVDHRDSILSDDEQAANDTMFICVSRARCPRLVLDL
ncbi:PDR/VanB family oxidoreductase (plasmid) [Mycolicibacterium psychrotolerans]|uniref:PDR/VanB family oxidoreductase n=1 Tax=Mycolicibacterium psychrotolerans TaxID=216929 RepID=UPI003D67FB3D